MATPLAKTFLCQKILATNEDVLSPIFVAIGLSSSNGAYSTDGITWTEASLPQDMAWNSVAYGYGKVGETLKNRLNTITKKF